MAKKPIVRLTDNFQHNLTEIEKFLEEADAIQVFGNVLDDLLETVIPNLQQFPQMGRPFLRRTLNSVESATAGRALQQQLAALTADSDSLREYVMDHICPVDFRTNSFGYRWGSRHNSVPYRQPVDPAGFSQTC